MKPWILGVPFALAVALASAAQAQQPPFPPPHGGPMMPPPREQVHAMVARHFAEIDTNHDGVVTRAEFDAALAKRRADYEVRRKARRDAEFTRLDTNRDGKLSRSEFDAPPPREGWGPPPGGPRMGPMRGPGRMGGPPLGPAWFDRADADHDGKVTLAEAQAMVDRMMDHWGPRHGPEGGRPGPGYDLPGRPPAR
jgi:hypothetical protein